MIDPFQILSGDSQLQCFLCADGNENRIIVLLQGTERHIYANLGVQNDVDACLLDIFNLPLNDIQGQAVIRNAIGHNTARPVLCLIHVHMVAQPCQIICTGQTRRSGTNDCHILVQLCHRLKLLIGGEALGIGPVGGKPFQLTDVHGFIHTAAAAAALAGMGADTAADAGERVIPKHNPGGSHVISGGN